VSRRLADEGATVLAVDLDLAAAEATAALSDAIQPFAADVADAAAARDYADAAARLGEGTIHLFFNNAGIEGPVAPIQDYGEDDFDRVMAVNVRGVFLGLKFVSRHMAKGGAVVNTASVAGTKGFAAMSGYTCSKHAVIGLTRAAALELAARGVRVNAICPGPVEGRMMASLEKGVDAENSHDLFLSTVPLGRYVPPAELANTITYLLSDEAAFATGSAFAVDGGQTAG
jgi:NAD(P)-dependent dehydrogenase (short-subunit alcohol dehydrogenase family)